MMPSRSRTILFVLAALGASGCTAVRPGAEVAPRADRLDALAVEALGFAASQYRRVASENHPSSGYPRATGKDGRWETVKINDWTSGFFPGTLWYLYEHTADPAFRTAAERWTLPLADIPKGRYTHDLGFQFHSSFVEANRLTREERFRGPALEAARLLAARYNPTVGAIKSWDWTDPKRPYPVIVDNMMNLELLFWGARNGGDPAWRELAIRHARTTLANHVRPDNGSYHVVVFDPASGRALERITHQGHADSTTWARGQAWLIYGFTMAYRETQEPDFLRAAQRVAGYALDRLPADRIPCWDFQAPGCPATAPRDASAAAVMASGLLELSLYAPASESARYRRTAEEILATLASPAYLARGTSSHAILLHSVGHHPKGTEIDVGIAYADYYFVEGLLRYLELRGARPRTLLPRPAETRDSLRVIALRADELERARALVRAGDPRLKPALDRLRADAAAAMGEGPFSVTHKKRVPPSGDRHDYMSMGPYWWPDPGKPNGLPYIRRDGERNPESLEDLDSPRLAKLTDAVETLAHAYYFTGEEEYAGRAALLLRTWFLDPATRMNPHLRFAQAIPGVVEGRGIGIIDGHRMVRLLDAVALVEQSSAWSAADREGLRTWMDRYLTWLRTSELGIDEADEENNHGTWYDAQLAAVALFVGRPEVAREVIEGSKSRRIATQVEPDGRQPRELARTRPLHYSVFNLEPFQLLAEMGRHVGADLWSYRSPHGASLRAAVDYLAPYADPSRRFPRPEVAPPDPDLLLVPLRRARLAYGDARYDDLLRRIPASVTRDHRSLLLYPDPEPRGRTAARGASMDERELRRVRTGRVEELFAGRFAGVEVLKLADGGIAVRVRGANNLQGGAEPLYVIDGMRIAPGPGGALQGINPEDITRIEVLKDIGSIAMYGVEGGNGVILISTKRER